MRAAACIAIVIAACLAAVALADDRPPLPDGVCAADDAVPYHAVTVAAVFGRLTDELSANARELAAALRARGLREGPPGRFSDGVMTIDVIEVADDRAAVDAALAAALDRDVVYYNGHEYHGELRALATPPPGAHVLVLDTCWSTQRYSARLLAPRLAIIGNSERTVTGSVGSFVALLDGMRAHRSWRELLAAMNAEATQRARVRVRSPFPRPERYRLDGACSVRGRAHPAGTAAIAAVAW